MSCVSGHFIFIETNQGIAASAAASGATLVRNSAQPPSKVLLWVYWVGLAICEGCALSLASLERVRYHEQAEELALISGFYPNILYHIMIKARIGLAIG